MGGPSRPIAAGDFDAATVRIEIRRKLRARPSDIGERRFRFGDVVDLADIGKSYDEQPYQ